MTWQRMNEFLLMLTLIEIVFANEKICDRKPVRTDTEPLPPDDRFRLSVDGIIDGKYIPNQHYTVSLLSNDRISTFMAFTISLSEDTIENTKNKRKPTLLKGGYLYPQSSNGKPSDVCNNTVIQRDQTPKTSVTVNWLAPPPKQGCVTIYAVVAVELGVWYDKEGPLVKKVCEDTRQKDDILPLLSTECNVCEEARYLLTFEGIWIYNTHNTTYPKNRELARFSDIVGASHNNNFVLWKLNKEATLGLKMLAEQGNTTKLEMEIQEQYLTGIRGVRTIIKAKAPATPSATTNAIFRVNKDYHRISLVTAILPSPDWFLGVTNLELCENNSNWAKNITFNLYPMDAGTDSGQDFESPNDETSPPQPIERAVFRDNNNRIFHDTRPFARLILNLIRTYENASCVLDNDSQLETSITTTDMPTEPTESPTDTTSEGQTSLIDQTECFYSEWDNWISCSGECIDGNMMGFQTRIRYHVVDGVLIDKYSDNRPIHKKIPSKCLEARTSETRECTCVCDERNECVDTTETPPIVPGKDWNNK